MPRLVVIQHGRVVRSEHVAHEVAAAGAQFTLKSGASVSLRIGEVTRIGTTEIRLVADDAAPGPTTATPAALSSPPAGAPEVAGYQIEGLLGRGGMGAVYRARQESTNREVALKVLGGHLIASDAARQRFVREVRLGARLEHPGVARVLDAGVAGSTPYYAMALVDGHALDRYWTLAQPDLRARVALLADVGRAVQHAHQRGIIHRDLKPSNIMVTPEGRPVVVDFGLAKALARAERRGSTPTPEGGERDGPAQVTEHGHIAGTFAYMAPEQAQGDADVIDTRADTFALGLILLEALTGRPARRLTGSRAEQTRAVIEEPVTVPAGASGVADPDLHAIITKAVSPSPDDRYATAGEWARDLARYLAGEPVLARPQTVRYVLGKWVARRRVAVAVGACIALALVGAGTVAVLMSIKARTAQLAMERDEAVHSAELAAMREQVGDLRVRAHELNRQLATTTLSSQQSNAIRREREEALARAEGLLARLRDAGADVSESQRALAADRAVPATTAGAPPTPAVATPTPAASPPVVTPFRDPTNAALLYTQAFLMHGERIKAVQGDWRDDPNWVPGAGTVGTLQALQPAVQTLLRAASLDQCDWGPEWSQGNRLLLPHIGFERAAGRLLALDARRLASAGDLDGAARRVAAMVGLARHACSDRLSIAALSASQLLQSSATEAERLAKAGAVPAAARAELRRQIERLSADDPAGIRASLTGERQANVEWLRVALKGPARADVLADLREWVGQSGMQGVNIARIAAMSDADIDVQCDRLGAFYKDASDAWVQPDAEARLSALKPDQYGEFGAFMAATVKMWRSSQDAKAALERLKRAVGS